MSFENCYFGYTGDGVGATEWYPGVPEWWDLPLVDCSVRLFEMELGSRGFSVPWAMYVDVDHEFWLNGNYPVHPNPSEKACMEAARTGAGYYVGVYGCQERTWSPGGNYSDPFVPLRILNLRPKIGPAAEDVW